MPGIDFNGRVKKAAKIIEQSGNPVEIEFGDDTAAPGHKGAPIKNIYKDGAAPRPAADVVEYGFEPGGVLLSCRVEEYSRDFALFADFLRDAKKYYKKTCLNAKFVYFFSYRPMYRELNHEQLCWYLFWRTRVRNGDYIKTGLSYIFLYIFEQINLSDIIGAGKVYANIINIWKHYRREFPRIDKYIIEWLTDFTLINNIRLNLDDIAEILPEIINAASIPEIYIKADFFENPANLGLILNNMTVYDYKKSKFYSDKESKNKDMFDYHIYKIVHAVISSEAFAKIIRAEIADGVKVKATRESFMGAVCAYEHKKKITLEYKNLWKNFYIRELITNAVRYAENMIRDYLQIKSKLNVSGQNFPAELAGIIKSYKNEHLAVAKPAKVSVKAKGRKNDAEPAAPPQEFAPDMEAAAEIERSSWETTNALLELQGKSTDFVGDDGGFEAIDTGAPDDLRGRLDEIAPTPDNNAPQTREQEDIFDVLEQYADPDEQPVGTQVSDMARLVADLSADELSAVELMLNGSFEEASAELMRARGVMLEAVVEGVNARAIDITGDIIIENGRVIDDYAEELKSCIGAS